jgi:hypothetical protein
MGSAISTNLQFPCRPPTTSCPTLSRSFDDTDIISSESDTVVFNDLGLNVSMTETLACAHKAEYHTDPAARRY